MTKVSVVKTSDRKHGVAEAIKLLGINPVKGKDVLIKPNFNTADPFPASTHNDTLIALINELRAMGAGKLTIGERSGPVSTSDVLIEKGIHQICDSMDVELINYDDMPDEQWEHIVPKDSSWRDGFYFARPVLEAQCNVSTCCIKTHAFGGGITISLKLTIGMVHRKNMNELHTSFLSQKKMMAEVNVPYAPELIIADGLDVFIDKGPMKGPIGSPGVILGGTDRIAIDAVGMAVLKLAGCNSKIMNTPIFEQMQIKRAVELGLGVSSVDEIELLPANDPESIDFAEKLKEVMYRK